MPEPIPSPNAEENLSEPSGSYDYALASPTPPTEPVPAPD